MDVLSKRVFVVPLKDKTENVMLQAFKKLIDDIGFKPHRIFSDKVIF